MQLVSPGENHDSVVHHLCAEEILVLLNDELLFGSESLPQGHGQQDGVRSGGYEEAGRGQTVLDTIVGHFFARVEQTRSVHHLQA